MTEGVTLHPEHLMDFLRFGRSTQGSIDQHQGLQVMPDVIAGSFQEPLLGEARTIGLPLSQFQLFLGSPIVWPGSASSRR